MKPKFFKTESEWRKWLSKNHLSKDVLWVGYYKVASGRPSITWPQSVDQALCFAWIDGLRRSIDERSYMIRFTPRRKNSHWSAVNLKRIKELMKAGLVHDVAVQGFKARNKAKDEKYFYEQRQAKLDAKYEKLIEANKKAWEFWKALAPSAKKASVWWIISAKKEETKMRRLGILIDSSAEGKLIPQLRRG
ncbi:MAG: bacteriocin-protection protein [Bacteroidia bacterium]|nr:bacteriocin-protection protein [Bacteroidia bacterium]